MFHIDAGISIITNSPLKLILACTLLIALLIFPAMAQQSAPPEGDRGITVMTRNLYLGTDLSPAIVAPNTSELIKAVIRISAEFQATNFSERAQALADEIATKQPDLIGLQEAVLLRSQYPANLSPTPNATTVGSDYLQLLLDALDARGQNYTPVVISTGFDVEVPRLRPDFTLEDIRFTDREVILARNDSLAANLNISNIQERNFANKLTIIPDSRSFTILRGWASADVEVRGRSFRFVTTHLEPSSSDVQVAQANELLQGPGNTSLPLVFIGDFNSNANGNGTLTYGNLIASGFVDTWSQAHPGDPGFTCCQDANLLNPTSKLSERIDLVLFRGNFSAIDVDIVGNNPANRTISGLWPSDHAGIVATLRFRTSS
jgi:endonuclease/exonuclease/phosphatase family metal-dependent hydrolase